MKSQRVRIQNFLISLVRDSLDFFAVTYNATAEANPFEANEPDFGTPITPASVLCNEQASTFDVDERKGRSLAGDRLTWDFEIKVGFDEEVTFEKFEERLAENPPFLPKDASEGLRQVRFFLQRTEVIHPVKHEAHAGTKAKFFVTAEQSRN